VKPKFLQGVRNMKQISISKEQARAFAAAFPIEEIKQYITVHRDEYEQFCVEEIKKDTNQTPLPKCRRSSRKNAKVAKAGGSL
jgi:hypothetical protein